MGNHALLPDVITANMILTSFHFAIYSHIRYMFTYSPLNGSSNMHNFVICTVMNCFYKKIAQMRVSLLMHSAEVCNLVQQMPPAPEGSTVMPQPHHQIWQPKGIT